MDRDGRVRMDGRPAGGHVGKKGRGGATGGKGGGGGGLGEQMVIHVRPNSSTKKLLDW